METFKSTTKINIFKNLKAEIIYLLYSSNIFKSLGFSQKIILIPKTSK